MILGKTLKQFFSMVLLICCVFRSEARKRKKKFFPYGWWHMVCDIRDEMTRNLLNSIRLVRVYNNILTTLPYMQNICVVRAHPSRTVFVRKEEWEWQKDEKNPKIKLLREKKLKLEKILHSTFPFVSKEKSIYVYAGKEWVKGSYTPKNRMNDF